MSAKIHQLVNSAMMVKSHQWTKDQTIGITDELIKGQGIEKIGQLVNVQMIETTN
jgi:hypothetical protein